MKNVFMKRFFFILVLLLTTIFSRAQFYCTLGYNMGFPLQLDNLNFVIDRYNETRTYLDKKFDHINYMDGFTFGLGASAFHFYFEFGYTNGSQVRQAEGTAPGGIYQIRQLRVKGSRFDLGGGYAFKHKKKATSFIGVQFNVGKFNVQTRVANDNIKHVHWSENLNLQASTWMTFGVSYRYAFARIPLSIEPYFQFLPKKLFNVDMTQDVSWVNTSLNPDTSQDDPSSLPVSLNTVGLKVCVFIILKKSEY